MDSGLITSPTQALAPPGPNLTPLPSYPLDSGGVDKVSKMLGGDVYAPEVKAAKENQVLDARTMALNKPPEPPPLKAPPKPENTSPIDAWGSMAMVFAGLASLKVRNHATTAMNAAAAALKGIQQKDRETFDQNFRTWEAENKNMLELANFQQRAYEDLIAHVGHTEELNAKVGEAEAREAEAKAKALTFAFSDTPGAAALAQGWDKFTELQRIRAENAQKMEIYKENLSKGARDVSTLLYEREIMGGKEYQEAVAAGDKDKQYELLMQANPEKYAKLRDDFDKARQKEEDSVGGQARESYNAWLQTPEGQAATPAEQFHQKVKMYGEFKLAGGRGAPIETTPQQEEFLAQELATYQQQPPTDRDIKNDPRWITRLARAKEINGGFDPSDYKLVQESRKNLRFGKLADTVSTYGRLDQHLKVFDDLVDKLPNTSDIKLLDSVAAKFGAQTGNANVTTYDAALELIGDEIVKAVSGTGAAGALGDREAIKAKLSDALSRGQLHQAIDTVRSLVGGAIAQTAKRFDMAPKNEVIQAFGLGEIADHFKLKVDLTPDKTGNVLWGSVYNIDPSGGITPVAGSPAPVTQPTAATQPSGPQPPAASDADGAVTTPQGAKMKQKDGRWLIFKPSDGLWYDLETKQPVK